HRLHAGAFVARFDEQISGGFEDRGALGHVLGSSRAARRRFRRGIGGLGGGGGFGVHAKYHTTRFYIRVRRSPPLTGVPMRAAEKSSRWLHGAAGALLATLMLASCGGERSEERRVGKRCMK